MERAEEVEGVEVALLGVPALEVEGVVVELMPGMCLLLPILGQLRLSPSGLAGHLGLGEVATTDQVVVLVVAPPLVVY